MILLGYLRIIFGFELQFELDPVTFIEYLQFIKLYSVIQPSIYEICEVSNICEVLTGLALAVRHIAQCENKSHVAKEMPHAFTTVAKCFFLTIAIFGGNVSRC